MGEREESSQAERKGAQEDARPSQGSFHSEGEEIGEEFRTPGYCRKVYSWHHPEVEPRKCFLIEAVFHTVIKFYSVSITSSHSGHRFHLEPTMYQAGVIIKYDDEILKSTKGH